MELNDAMRTQHACRYYSPDPVPDEIFYNAVEVARFGPQGGNRQPVRFLIVADAAKKRQLAEWYLVPWKAYIEAAMAGAGAIEADDDGDEKATWIRPRQAEKALDRRRPLRRALRRAPGDRRRLRRPRRRRTRPTPSSAG